MSDTVTAALRDRIDAIEGGYEFFLSYAAKGFKGDPATGGELRDCLQRMDTAMDRLGEFLSALVSKRGLEPLARARRKSLRPREWPLLWAACPAW